MLTGEYKLKKDLFDRIYIEVEGKYYETKFNNSNF